MTSSRDLLRILLDSKPFIDKELHSKLFHKVRAKIRLRHSITIPSHIPVPYAIHPHADIGDLKTTYRRMISALGMPRAIRDYCEAVTRFTAKSL